MAKFTFKEAFKSMVFLNSLLIGLILTFLAYLASELSYGNQAKISIDIGLGLIFFSIVGISIFYGSTLIKNELKSGNLFFLLPKLSSRSPYLIGRIFGVALILFLEMCFMSLFLFGIFKFFGGELNYLIFICLIFMYLTSLILLLVAVFFSQITNTITTIFASIFVYLIGYGLFNSLEKKLIPERTVIKSFLDFLSYFFPNFYALDIKDYLFYKNHLDGGYIFQIIISALFYILILMVINLNVFRKKDL